MAFNSIDELWTNAVRRLLMHGREISSRLGNTTKETLGFSTKLASINKTFLLNRRRKLSPTYACAEFLWYMKHTKNIEMIKAYAPQYVEFAENDEAFGAYGWRFYENLTQDFTKTTSQFELLIRHLSETPNSRQAIVTLWEADDLPHTYEKDHKDLPCTLAMQFIIRDDELHLIVTMRSNDVWLGLPYDVFAFTCIQRLVADALGVECGTYTHQVGSLHLYEKNWQAASESLNKLRRVSSVNTCLKHGWFKRNELKDLTNQEAYWKTQVQRALLAEGRYRNGLDGSAEQAKLCDMLYDAVSCCARRFGWLKPTHSPVLQEALKNFTVKENDHETGQISKSSTTEMEELKRRKQRSCKIYD